MYKTLIISFGILLLGFMLVLISEETLSVRNTDILNITGLLLMAIALAYRTIKEAFTGIKKWFKKIGKDKDKTL